MRWQYYYYVRWRGMRAHNRPDHCGSFRRECSIMLRDIVARIIKYLAAATFVSVALAMVAVLFSPMTLYAHSFTAPVPAVGSDALIFA